MARPPIVVSNGGVLDNLANGLKSNTELSVVEQIKENIKQLNKRSHGQGQNPQSEYKERSIIRMIESQHRDDPKILWCLASEDIQLLKKNLPKLGVQDNNAELSE